MDTIGVVSDAITIVTFFENLIPSRDPDQGTKVTIKAGLGGINSDEDDHVSPTTDFRQRYLIANGYRVAK
jgi:hypothetical protein